MGNQIIFGNENTGTFQVWQHLCLGGLAYGVATLLGYGSRAKFIGLMTLLGSAGINHIYNATQRENNFRCPRTAF